MGNACAALPTWKSIFKICFQLDALDDFIFQKFCFRIPSRCGNLYKISFHLVCLLAVLVLISVF